MKHQQQWADIPVDCCGYCPSEKGRASGTPLILHMQCADLHAITCLPPVLYVLQGLYFESPINAQGALVILPTRHKLTTFALRCRGQVFGKDPAAERLASVWQDQVGLVVDASGSPASSALSFPALPAALASAGFYVVTAGDQGLAVFERSSGDCVQQLPYGEGIVVAPGQQVLAADDVHGSCIAIAGNRKVGHPPSPAQGCRQSCDLGDPCHAGRKGQIICEHRGYGPF